MTISLFPESFGEDSFRSRPNRNESNGKKKKSHSENNGSNECVGYCSRGHGTGRDGGYECCS